MKKTRGQKSNASVPLITSKKALIHSATYQHKFFFIVSDLRPNEAEHASHVTLVPEQGLPLQAALRLQINILLRPLQYIQILEDIPTLVYPMIWYETLTMEAPPPEDLHGRPAPTA